MKKNTQSNTGQGLDAVVERREFYKDMYSKQWKVAIAGVVSLIASIMVLTASLMKEETNKYFAVDSNFQMIQLIALDQPNVKNSVVANWLTRSLVDTFDFNYHNIKQHLNETSMKWFTKEGANALITALDTSGNFDVILERKLLVSLAITDVPVVVKEGVLNNIKLWKLQVPATITYRNESSVSSNNVVFTVTISRVSLLSDPVGLGIAKIVMEKV